MTTEDRRPDADGPGVEVTQDAQPGDAPAPSSSTTRRRTSRRRSPSSVASQAEGEHPTSPPPDASATTPRRRAPRAAKTDASEAPTAADSSDESVTAAPSQPEEAEKPRRAARSRRTKRPSEGTASAEPEIAAEPTEAPAAGEAPAGVQAPAQTADDTTSPRSRRRGRTRVQPSLEEPPSAAAEVAESPKEGEPPVQVPAAPEPQAPKGRSRGRRAASREAGAVSETVEAVQPAAGEEKPARRRAARGERKTKAKHAAPEAVEPIRGARLELAEAFPAVRVREQTHAPTLFFGSVAGQKQARRVASEVQRAARAGVPILSTLVELICPLPADDSVYESLDERIAALTANYPEALILPRLVFVPAQGWRQQYPNEVQQYQENATDDPSIASERFWFEAELALRKLIAHVRRTTYGERVIGYHLERGEWFHPIYTGYDRSYANREGFRDWLRAKYGNNEVALRAAWFDGQVQFYTAEVPPQPAPRKEVAFFEPRRERRWIDFLEYTSEVTAQRLGRLAQTVKEATEGEALVSVCYGYTFEFGHTFSGHLALHRLLAEPSIDIVAGPPAYRGRQPGGSGAFPSPVNSIGLHGKLWLSEDDTKTHLAIQDQGDDFNPRMPGRGATDAVHSRAVGMALAYRCGIGWMDLWGDGWLDSEDVWRSARAYLRRTALARSSRRAESPEVVALVDERSLLHVQRGEEFVRRLLHDQRNLLLRSGASVGFYLQSDVTHPDFPTDAKLYLFLTPYRLPEDQRAAIRERIQSGGKTLVWMYAVGACTDRGEIGESPHDLLGFSLRPQAWLSEIGSRTTDVRHPITESIRDRIIGQRERLSPSYYVDDDSPGIITLAEYAQSGLPSLVVREFGEWRSVFCGEPTLSQELLRGLCRYAGVHLYTPGAEEYVYANSGWLTVHAIRDGQRTVRPRPGEALYDLDAEALVSEGPDFRCHMRSGTTRSFLSLPAPVLRDLGLNTERRIAEPQDQEPVAEPAGADESAAPTADLVGEDLAEAIKEMEEMRAERLAEAAEEEALAADGEEGEDDSAEGLPDDGEEQETGAAALSGSDAETAEKKRRRRRRGGRGRGRRRRTASPESDGGGSAGGSSG